VTTRRKPAATSLGFSADFKPGERDRVSIAFQSTQNYVDFFARQFNFNIQRVTAGGFGPGFTHGATGATGTASFGNVQVTNNAINRTNRTMMPTLTWRHEGPSWRFEGGFGYSRATNADRDTDFGFFQGATATRGRLRINFDNVGYLRPGEITVRDDNTGAPFDPYRLDGKALTTAVSNPRDWSDVRRSAHLSASRDFAGRVPVTLKAGLDARQSERDGRGGTMTFTYVGADGVAAPTPNTPVGNDNSAGRFLDEEFSQRIPPFGFPRTDWLSAAKIHRAHTASPAHFTSNAVDSYNNFTNTSKHAEELISSAYLRGDAAFLERRLKITTGLRAEQTNIEATGPLNDPTGNLRRDASGRPIPGATIFPAGSLDARRLILVDRGLRTEKEYLRLFPSLNANYALRENLMLRGAWYWSVGRPDFNQYASGVTLPDLTVNPDPNNASGRITVNNVGIKPWKAETFKVRAEYYFERVGQVSIGAFRRDYTNFWQTQRVVPTPEFFDGYGIDPATYGAYEFFTQANQPGTYTLTGTEFDYRQALTFLPAWARGGAGVCQCLADPAVGGGAGQRCLRRLCAAHLQLGRESHATEVQPPGALELSRAPAAQRDRQRRHRTRHLPLRHPAPVPGCAGRVQTGAASRAVHEPAQPHRRDGGLRGLRAEHAGLRPPAQHLRLPLAVDLRRQGQLLSSGVGAALRQSVRNASTGLSNEARIAG
jgi:iron complex outermembrane receptor protein